MNTRKNQATLSTAEKAAFVNAVLKLKSSMPSQLGLASRYDDYVQIHSESMMTNPSWAHRGPAFGPWHRALLRNLELDLQHASNDPGIALPYWDWTTDQMTDTSPGSPWTDDFMGKMDPATDIVTSGPFRQGSWTLTITEMGMGMGGNNDPMLRRAMGRAQFQDPGSAVNSLPTSQNVVSALQETPYDSPQWAMGSIPSFRDRLEGWHGAGSIHNRVHLWVGGTMLPMTSPNDPIFFLHHCNVDRVWAQWQQMHNTLPYVPAVTAPGAPQGHRLTDTMKPWGAPVTVQSVLDHRMMGYEYDTDPAGPMALIAMPAQGIAHALPKWQPLAAQKRGNMKMVGPMFELSAEDKAAGGHDLR